ncbi:MAG TPA: hypothetical protein VF692_11445 [Pyrinomonadaceae bacterium]|jgi:hypothetical protein
MNGKLKQILVYLLPMGLFAVISIIMSKIVYNSLFESSQSCRELLSKDTDAKSWYACSYFYSAASTVYQSVTSLYLPVIFILIFLIVQALQRIWKLENEIKEIKDKVKCLI